MILIQYQSFKKEYLAFILVPDQTRVHLSAVFKFLFHLVLLQFIKVKLKKPATALNDIKNSKYHFFPKTSLHDLKRTNLLQNTFFFSELFTWQWHLSSCVFLATSYVPEYLGSSREAMLSERASQELWLFTREDNWTFNIRKRFDSTVTCISRR